MPLNAKLVVVGGEVKTAEIKLRLPSTIGRGRGATIMLPHPLVSRQHCELFETDGQLMVRDLGSLNGTYVNNERIAGDASLPPGELLTVGAVTFRAVYDQQETIAPPEGPPPKSRSTATETVRTGEARPQAAAAAPKLLEDDDDNVDFNFNAPLMSDNEDDEAGDTATPKAGPKTDATVEDVQVEEPPEKPAAKPAGKPAAKPVAAKPAVPAKPAKPGNDEKTTKWNDDEEEPVAEKDDEDDFGDFLKSLNK